MHSDGASKSQKAIPYLFVLPAILLFCVFSIYAFIYMYGLSLFEWDGVRISKQFVWLSNYWSVIAHDKQFWVSFKQAGYITLLALVFQNSLALMLAIAVNRPMR